MSDWEEIYWELSAKYDETFSKAQGIIDRQRVEIDNLHAQLDAIKPPLTRLYHQGPDGVLRELKRVSAEEFMGMDHTLKGIPVVYAVWPEEPSE